MSICQEYFFEVKRKRNDTDFELTSAAKLTKKSTCRGVQRRMQVIRLRRVAVDTVKRNTCYVIYKYIVFI